MLQISKIDSPPTRLLSWSDKHLQRAKGVCRIAVGGSENGNEIVDVFQQSPLRVIFPRIDGATAKEAVLINTGGGIAGGDRLECSVTAVASASIAVRSQTTERVYRALDQPARIMTKLRVDDAQSSRGFPTRRSFSTGRGSTGRRRSRFLLDRSWLLSSGLCLVGPRTASRWLARRFAIAGALRRKVG
jgi:hypothetical protein